MARVAAMTPTAQQVRATCVVVQWYLRTHFHTNDDPGTPAMFLDRAKVGDFAISDDELRGGDPPALFRLLIATAMFQRLQDVLVLKILRGIGPADAKELTNARRLLALVDSGKCDLHSDTASLHGVCDLAKESGRATCSAAPKTQCHLKRHTVLLKRYGHFGKMPTSLALILREAKATNLNQLRAQVLSRFIDPVERAQQLELVLSRAWRISSKIAAMFLSLITNPDLGPAPWREGLDWTYFVVVDTNVEHFLDAIGYRGSRTYPARRAFVHALSRRIHLREIDSRVKFDFNPRIVQQALYLFMSRPNRRRLTRDCMHVAGACTRCPHSLAKHCPVSAP